MNFLSWFFFVFQSYEKDSIYNKIFSIFRKFFGSHSSTQMYHQMVPNLLVTFWVLRMHYQNNMLPNYPSLMKKFLLLHCTHCTHIVHTFAVLLSQLIFGMSTNDIEISPESLSKRLTEKDKNLSSSPLLPSFANPYQKVSSSSSFRLPVICFATGPASICVVLVRPHRYWFTISESGNMFLNSLATWSAVIKGKLCSIKKTYFGLSLQLLSLHKDRLIIFVAVQHPHIPYALRCPCVYWYHFFFHVQHWNHLHTVRRPKNSPVRDFWIIWIYYSTNLWFSQNICVTDLALNCLSSFCNVLIFFTVLFLHSNK